MTEFAHAAEGHRRELLLHCYRMLGSLPEAEDAVQETMLRAWRYRDSLKEGAPLRPWLYRVATNACLDAIARDERRAVLAAKVAADDGAAGKLDDVVWLRPIPDSQLEPPTPPTSTPEAITLTGETIEIAFLTVIQLLTPQQRAALILCDVLDWSAKEAADLLDITVGALNSSLQRARARLRERLPSSKPAWPANADPSAAERDLLKKYVEASEAADFRALESIIRTDATFRMPPQPGVAEGRDAMFSLWVAGGFGSERFGRLRCVVTRANLQPAVAAYWRRPGDSAWRALALDVLRIEDGVIAEIVTFPPDCFLPFGLPLIMDEASGSTRVIDLLNAHVPGSSQLKLVSLKRKADKHIHGANRMNAPASITITPVRVADLLAEGERMPVYVHIIDHPDARVLVDTGMTELHPAAADLDPRLRPLSKQNFDLAGIDIVVNTHLHFDHCGGNHLFAGRPIYVQRRELDDARNEDSYTIREWVDAPGVQYVPVDGDHELLPGIRLVPAPGHTRGMQVIVVETGGRPVVVGGDVAVWFGELDEPHSEGQLRVRALDPELVWLTHTDEPWRPRTV